MFNRMIKPMIFIMLFVLILMFTYIFTPVSYESLSMKALENSHYNGRLINEEYFKNKEFALLAIKHSAGNIEFIPDKEKDYIIHAFLRQKNHTYVPKTYSNNKYIMSKLIEKDIANIAHTDLSIIYDKEIVSAVLSHEKAYDKIMHHSEIFHLYCDIEKILKNKKDLLYFSDKIKTGYIKTSIKLDSNCHERYERPIRSMRKVLYSKNEGAIRDIVMLHPQIITLNIRYFGEKVGNIINKIKDDEDFIFKAISLSDSAPFFNYLPKKYFYKKEFVLASLKSGVSELRDMIKEFKSDPDVIIAAVKHDASALQFANKKIINDSGFFLKILEVNNHKLKSTIKIFKNWGGVIAEKIINDKELAIKILSQSPYSYRWLSPKLRADKELTMLAINNSEDGTVIEHLPEPMKSDKDVILAAINKSGSNIEFASDKLKADKEIALAAVKNSNLAMLFIAEDLKSDKEVILSSVKKSIISLRLVSEEIKSDKEFIKKIIDSSIDRDNLSLGVLTKKELSDKNAIIDAINNGYHRGFDYISKELKSDKEVALVAINNGVAAFHQLSKELMSDKDIITAYIKTGPSISINDVPEHLVLDKNIVFNAYHSKNWGFIFGSVNKFITENPILGILEGRLKMEVGYKLYFLSKIAF